MSTAAEIGEDVFPTTTKLVYVKLVGVERESENVASIGSNSKCFLYLAILPRWFITKYTKELFPLVHN